MFLRYNRDEAQIREVHAAPCSCLQQRKQLLLQVVGARGGMKETGWMDDTNRQRDKKKMKWQVRLELTLSFNVLPN